VKVLLLSMPDSFEHMSSITVRMPNGALSSLAGNVDAHHQVWVADLILAQGRVRETVESLVREHEPDVVGLSVMTFQRRTAKRLVGLLRHLRPAARIVVGGYDPSLAPEAWTDGSADVIVRGEGELAFRELLRAYEGGASLATVQGLTYREGSSYLRTAARPVIGIESGEVRLPARGSRVLSGYTLLGRQVDVVETSRGCTFDCTFCSIIEMRGRNFHTYSLARVLADIRDARDHGARAIFLVDDNITLNVQRFESLCRAIVDAGLHTIEYMVQGMTSAIANADEGLAPLMRKAGFRYVFLGIENILEEDLGFLKAGAKNAQRENGRRTGNATLRAIELLRRSGMYVVGGLIVGNPSDTRESIEANLDFAARHVDWPYIQHPTPYPATPLTRDLAARGLIAHDHVEEYDGTTAVVKSEHLSGEEIEFLRWRRERWMKVRHFPAALARSPWFVLRHAREMMAHTFRGSSIRSALGLESERAVFARYQALRRREREYL
jgi:anaerobic magnesium-protoporphyrin IX monomethyl ester cyclase